MTCIQIQNEAALFHIVLILLQINAAVLPPDMGKLLCILRSLTLVWQPVLEKGN